LQGVAAKELGALLSMLVNLNVFPGGIDEINKLLQVSFMSRSGFR
jgi:hypothetical protein